MTVSDFQTIGADVARAFDGLGSKIPRVRYGSAKVLRMVSEQAPELLYPWWDSLVRLLENENAFLRWGSTLILGNLAAVDRRGVAYFSQMVRPGATALPTVSCATTGPVGMKPAGTRALTCSNPTVAGALPA